MMGQDRRLRIQRPDEDAYVVGGGSDGPRRCARAAAAATVRRRWPQAKQVNNRIVGRMRMERHCAAVAPDIDSECAGSIRGHFMLLSASTRPFGPLGPFHGTNDTLALRCAILSRRFDDFWKRHARGTMSAILTKTLT